MRELYIDRLRVVLTATVLFFHAAITYGGAGKWFYQEIAPSRAASTAVLGLFCLTIQAFFMGFFFFAAGYFTPHSFDRKGATAFLRDRCCRLGLPLLFFCLALGPLTVAIVEGARGHGFSSTLLLLYRSWKFPNGPLWFTEALLIFSFTYALSRVVADRASRQEHEGEKPSTIATQPTATSAVFEAPVPGTAAWLLSAVGVGAGALLLRRLSSPGYRFLGMWVGDFSSYIFLFILGTVAARRGWLARLTWRQALPSIIAACIVWPLLPLAYFIYQLRGGDPASTAYRFAWPNAVHAFWEPFVAWGILATLLLWFRAHLNRPSRFWDWLGRRAYAVYILHTPVLVSVCLAMRSWHGPALAKWAVAGTLTCIATWLLADPLVRIPGLRRIV